MYSTDTRLAGVALALATLLLSGAATAGNLQVNAGKGVNINAECNISSDYDFHLTERSVVFTRKTGTPKTVLMRQGRLFVDDQWVAVSAADSRLLRDYERDARETMPLAQQIGRDAAGNSLRTHCMLTDISERRRAEDELRELNRHLEERIEQRTRDLELAKNAAEADEHFMQRLIDAIPGQVAYVNRDLRFEFANKAYREWFGRRA